jgi:hypothetical protein
MPGHKNHKANALKHELNKLSDKPGSSARMAKHVAAGEAKAPAIATVADIAAARKARAKARPPAEGKTSPGHASFDPSDFGVGIEPNPEISARWQARHADLVARHVKDLGGAGLSERKLSLIRRAASLELSLEQMDAEVSGGLEVDRDTYHRATELLLTTLERLERSKGA